MVLCVSQSINEYEPVCDVNDLLLPATLSSFTVCVSGGICHILSGQKQSLSPKCEKNGAHCYKMINNSKLNQDYKISLKDRR